MTLKKTKPRTPTRCERAEQACGATSSLKMQFYKAGLEMPQPQRCLSWAGLIFWTSPLTSKHFAFGTEQATFSLDTLKIFTKWNCPFTTHL